MTVEDHRFSSLATYTLIFWPYVCLVYIVSYWLPLSPTFSKYTTSYVSLFSLSLVSFHSQGSVGCGGLATAFRHNWQFGGIKKTRWFLKRMEGGKKKEEEVDVLPFILLRFFLFDSSRERGKRNPKWHHMRPRARVCVTFWETDYVAENSNRGN